MIELLRLSKMCDKIVSIQNNGQWNNTLKIRKDESTFEIERALFETFGVCTILEYLCVFSREFPLL